MKSRDATAYKLYMKRKYTFNGTCSVGFCFLLVLVGRARERERERERGGREGELERKRRE